MKKLKLLFIVLSFCTIKNQAQTVTDYDGNVYDTVIIGTQVWMKQNLKVTHYNNGNPIPNIEDNATWANTISGARCYYNNDSIVHNSIYGALYNWYAVKNNYNICPSGWHVSTEAEWIEAENFLGGDSIAGGKMKEVGTSHWSAPNVDATNSSRFTGLPGGFRSFNSGFQYLHENGLWWTATEVDVNWAKSVYFWNQYGGVDHNPGSKRYGFSIRCIRNTSYNGTREMNLQDKIKVYPNPAIDKVTIEYTANQDLQVQIYNVIGVCVLQTKLEKEIKEIDISSLPTGVFVMNISCEEWSLQKKFIKQ